MIARPRHEGREASGLLGWDKGLGGDRPQATEEMTLNQSLVEEAARAWFAELGYARAHRPQLAFLTHSLTHSLTHNLTYA